MCRAFPGFRCSSHPHLAVRVISRKVHNLEKEIEKAITEQRDYRAETDNWEGTTEDQQFDTAIEKFRSEITVLEERKNKELTDFAMTRAGKEALQQAIADSKTEEEELAENAKYTEGEEAKRIKKDQALARQRTIDLESEMVAAESRRAKQEKLAKYMTAPEVSNSAKKWRVKKELKKTHKELKAYEERSNTIRERLLKIQEELLYAKERGDVREEHSLNEEKAHLLKEKSFIEKQEKHTRAHLASCQSWLKKIMENKIDKTFDFIDSLANKYIDHMFQY